MDNMPKKNEGSFTMFILGLCIFLLGIHLFSIDWYIFGVILIVVGLFFLLVGCILIYGELPTKKNIERLREINNSIEKEKAKEIRLYNERIESYKKEVEEMTINYGEITKEIRYKNSLSYGYHCINCSEHDYVNSFSRKKDTIYVFESSSMMIINNNPYNFKDIISFEVIDNSNIIYSNQTLTTKSNAGRVIGRAAVGGLLFGGAGAIIGGATAPKNTIVPEQNTQTTHDYTIVITVNSLSAPIVYLPIGNKENIMHEISSVLSIICERNKQKTD